MAKEITVKVGRALSADQVRKLDRSKMAVLHPQPPKHAVEGQETLYAPVQCPWCGALGFEWFDSEYYTSIYCNACGSYFFA